MRNILIFLTLFSTSGWAHNKIEEIPTTGLSDADYRELLEEAHEALEGEHHQHAGCCSDSTVHTHSEPNRWSEFKDKFRFKKILINAYRWYWSHQDRPEVANASANIVAMLLASHFTEVVGGNVMVASSASSGFSSWTDWGLATFGVIIQAPGFDPLCLVLIGSYGKWPKTFDRWLTRPRIFAVKLLGASQAFVGIPEGYLAGVLSEYRDKMFQNRFKGVAIGTSTFRILGGDGQRTVDLKMRPGFGGMLELESVEFGSQAQAMNRIYLSETARAFGANIQALVLEIQDRLEDRKLLELSEQPYIAGLKQSEGDSLTVQVKAGAFPFLSRAVLNCERQLL
jgi:hypothetical protein